MVITSFEGGASGFSKIGATKSASLRPPSSAAPCPLVGGSGIDLYSDSVSRKIIDDVWHPSQQKYFLPFCKEAVKDKAIKGAI